MDIREFALKYQVKVQSDLDCTETIPGNSGHIYVYGPGTLAVMLMPKTDGNGLWTRFRRSCNDLGMVITQDGDFEGAATFDPSDRRQARAALKAAGIRSTRRPSQRQLAALAAHRRPFRAKQHVDKQALSVAGSVLGAEVGM